MCNQKKNNVKVPHQLSCVLSIKSGPIPPTLNNNNKILIKGYMRYFEQHFVQYKYKLRKTSQLPKSPTILQQVAPPPTSHKLQSSLTNSQSFDLFFFWSREERLLFQVTPPIPNLFYLNRH